MVYPWFHRFVILFRKLADLYIIKVTTVLVKVKFVLQTDVFIFVLQVCKQLHLLVSFIVLKKATILSTTCFQRPVSILPLTPVVIT